MKSIKSKISLILIIFILLTIIKDDSDRLNKLVDELLDLSKMESGKIIMKVADVSIEKIIKDIIKVFKIQFEEKKINFNFDVSGITRFVKADENKISWVIANLVGNALRYIDDKGDGKIDIVAKEVNNTILISVKDNGEGIPEEYQDKIFERFIQLKNKNGEITGSSGLGLAICKEIVKANSGELWVDSIANHGSTFYFTLKLGGVIYEKNINC